MNRQEKEAVVGQVREMLGSADATFVVNYRGLGVEDLQSLRKNLREHEGAFKVTKARLMKIAAQEQKELAQLQESFKDQVGLVFANGDVAATAKTIAQFAKEHQALEIISGFFEGRCLTREEVLFVASLPSRPELLGRLAGTLQAPISSLARMLHMMLVRLAFVLQQVKEGKESKGE